MDRTDRQLGMDKDISRRDFLNGYAYGHDPETDRIAFEPSSWPEGKRHWVSGSRPFGNISIASTDAASNAMTESAIEEAHRAVNELP